MTNVPHTGNVVGLFAGIGGFELGFRDAGFHTSSFCEIDPAARRVLERRFPSSEIVEDVRAIDRLPESTDVVCAGFPCQDLSSVGPKHGVKGARSSLIDEVFRLLERSPVEWVVLENVRFMLHLGRGAAMQHVTTNLERLGYRWAYRVIDARAFGRPQRRHRVFFVASRSHDPRDVLLSEDAGPATDDRPTLDEPVGFYWTEGTYASGLAANGVPPLKGGSTVGIPSPPAILFPDGRVATPDVRDAERLQGFRADWTKPAEDVVKASMRWKLVGNAVHVPVARWLAKRLLDPQPYDGTGDEPLGDKWPAAAWSIGDGRFGAEVSNYPVRRRAQSIATFLRHPGRDLSVKATTGFIRRARAGSLRFPEGFVEALERHVALAGR